MAEEAPVAPAVLTAKRVADDLRGQMVEGVLLPGTPLREASLAAKFGVSRNTLREGLRLLAAEGLVLQHLYSGVVVATLTPEHVRDIYVVRHTLEVRAVEESAVAPQYRLQALATAVAQEAEGARQDEWQAVGTAGLHFHQALVGLLDSALFDDFFRRIVAQLRLTFAGARSEADLQRPWLDRDRAICDLVLGGRRTEAAAALRDYLRDSERLALDLVRHAAMPTRLTPAPKSPHHRN
jgi:DNA-binding GntR family transcriptional regulator